MKIYLKNNVFQESLNRIRRLYDEFENIVVGFSGGKDSTICLNLTIQVAKERNRLPVSVMWLDQESEWQAVNNYVKSVMLREEVNPLWFQIPFRETMNTSYGEKFFNVWDEQKESEWIRPKDELSIKVNDFGTDRFHDLFTLIPRKLFNDENFCYIAGVRAEESPARTMAVTQVATYKDITWGKVLDKKRKHYTFYPIYDWSYTDVWKAIHEHNWDYCNLYDRMYQYGLGINLMRISSVQHETAIHALFFMQEIEPDTWNAVVKRLEGINTFSKLSKETFYAPKELPTMFSTWNEYRDYLAENLLSNDDFPKFKKQFEKIDQIYYGVKINEAISKACIGAVLLNDFEMRKIGNFKKIADVGYWLQWSRGLLKNDNKKNKYILDSISRGEKPRTNE